MPRLAPTVMPDTYTTLACYPDHVAASRHGRLPPRDPSPIHSGGRSRVLGVLVLVALSTVLALAVETGVRRMMMPPDFEQVRAWLSPTLEPWAWAIAVVTAFACAGGWWLFGVLLRRGLARARPGLAPDRARARAELDAAILASSVPQVPAVVGTMLFMMGAPLLPVVTAMAVAVLGVLSLGLRVQLGSRDQG